MSCVVRSVLFRTTQDIPPLCSPAMAVCLTVPRPTASTPLSARLVWPRRALIWAYLAALFMAGVAHWVLFFDRGRMSFNPHDWPKEAMYLSVWREALTTGRIPWHISRPIQDTDRFLANPETLLSLQLILLPFVSHGQFIVANTLLFYAIGFAGCLLLRRRYHLSVLPFTLLYLLYNFNGHITAHLAIGHTQWTGYFLLPFFALYLLELLEGPAAPCTSVVMVSAAAVSGGTRGERRHVFSPLGLAGFPLLRQGWNGAGSAVPPAALKLALVLAAMFFQGAFHFYVWTALFLMLVCLFNQAYGRPLLIAIAGGAAAGSVRVLPAIATFWGRDTDFLSGYPTLGQLLEGLVSLRPSTYPWTGYVFDTLGWWEYDLYVGLAGLAALVYFGIYLAVRSRPVLPGDEVWQRLQLPLLCQALLSFSFVYAPIAALPLPLISAERVSTRFILIPFFLVTLAAALQLQRWLERAGPGLRLRAACGAGLVVLASDLATHSWVWALPRIEETYRGRTFDKAVSIINRPDAGYILTAGAGLVISLISLAVIGGLLLTNARRARCRATGSVSA